MKTLGRIWQAWKHFGQVIGDFVARAILTVFYFTIFVPFGLAVRLARDPLDMKASKTPQWLQRRTSDITLDDARRVS